jgi:hypothetical protein
LDLEAQASSEVVSARLGLVVAAVGGPVESQLNAVIVFAGQVEQVADLADGQGDQPASRVAVFTACGWWCLALIRL